ISRPIALPCTVRPTNAAASTRPANARNTAATLRPKRTRGDRRRGRELTRASWGTGEPRGKRIARIPRSAVRAPPDHPEPRDGGATVAELAGERRHDHRTIAWNDGGVVARFVERPGLVRHLRAVREVTQEHGAVLALLEDREDRIARRSVLALSTLEAQQKRHRLARGHHVLVAARSGLEVIHLAR